VSKHSKGEGVSVGYCITFPLTAALPHTSVSRYFHWGKLVFLGSRWRVFFPVKNTYVQAKKLDTTQSISFAALVPYGRSRQTRRTRTALPSAQRGALRPGCTGRASAGRHGPCHARQSQALSEQPRPPSRRHTYGSSAPCLPTRLSLRLQVWTRRLTVGFCPPKTTDVAAAALVPVAPAALCTGASSGWQHHGLSPPPGGTHLHPP